MMSARIQAIFLCILVAFIFSLHYLIAKLVLRELSPFTLASLRGVVGGLILVLVFRKKILSQLTAQVCLRLLPIGFLGFFLNQLLFLHGLKLSSATDAALISNTIPFVSALMAWGMLGEKLHRNAILGFLLGLGTVCTYQLLALRYAPEEVSLGQLYIFLNVLCFAISVALVRKTLADLKPELVSALTLLWGGLLATMMALPDFTQEISSALTKSELWFPLFFEVVIATAVVYFLNYKSLKTLQVREAAIFMHLQIPMTAALSSYLADEAMPQSLSIVFMCLVLASCLVHRK